MIRSMSAVIHPLTRPFPILNGIDAEDKVFDLPEDKAHREPGTGLGLSIAKEIADQLGFELTVQSERHAGSTFTLLIPFADDVMQSLSQLKDVYDSESGHTAQHDFSRSGATEDDED